MEKIIQNNDEFRIVSLQSIDHSLPVGNYLVKQDPKTGEYYLENKSPFKLPDKIYGDDHSITSRWAASWKYNAIKNMGILLSGTRGSGKSILAQKFCIEMNMPVIMINSPFSGPDFTSFITNPLFDESIIFIDELEKVYQSSRTSYNEYGEAESGGKDAQKDLLGIMDGNYPTKLIFLFTVNVASDLNEYLINRLSRIKYRKHFSGLDRKIMDAIIDDLLDDKSYRESIYELFKKIGICTMDLLIPIIQECNLHKEDALVCAQYLNLQCERRYYEIIEVFKGKEYKCDSASFSLDQRDCIYINRSWLTEKETKKGFENERCGITINPFQDKFDIVSEEEVRITTLNKNVFICRVKDNVSLIF